MTDIEQKALTLLLDAYADRGIEYSHEPIDRNYADHEALCRAIEQHETTKQAFSAFKQKVSYAIEDVTDRDLPVDVLRRFVIEADPLVEAWIEATGNTVGMEPLNAALKARGLEIRDKNDD